TTRVDLHWTELGELKHLCVNLQSMTCPHIPDTPLLLFTLPVAHKLSTGRRMHPLPGRKVQEILPVARNYPLLQLAALVGQVRILTAQCKLRQLVLAIEQGARHEIEQAMRIAGDEVDRSLMQAKCRIKQLFKGCPPFARGPHKADV